MPGKRGIDTYKEREFFEYRPEIGRTPDAGVSPYLDPTTEDVPTTELTDREKAYLDAIRLADEKLLDIEQLLDDQQALLSIPVDATLRPDVGRALDYVLQSNMIRGISETQNEPTITFPIFRWSHETIKEGGVFRGSGGDPHGVTVQQGRDLASQVSEWDSNRVLELVAYHIISITLDFLGKKVIPGGPVFDPLKKPVIEWAKRMLHEAMFNSPPEPSLGEHNKDNEVPFDKDGAYGRIKNNPKPKGMPKDIPPVEAVGFANTIVSFVYEKAREGDTPGANPSSFYMRPMYEYARETHVATKVAVQTSANSTFEVYNTFGEPLKLITPSDFLRYSGYVGNKRMSEYNALLDGGVENRSISTSAAFQSLAEAGYDTFNRTLDQMSYTLRYWYQSPEVLCCLIRALGLVGKMDKSILYGIRFIIINLIQDEVNNLQFIFDSISELLNSLVLGLVSKVFSIIDSLAGVVTGKISKLIAAISDDAVTRDCSPLDELLAVLSGGLVSLNIELATMISGFIGELGIRDVKLKVTTGNIERKGRYERLLKIIDAIINAVETGDLCADDPDKSVSGRGQQIPPPPSADEVQNFLTIGLLPTFEEATRGRDYIIKRYGRDPATGKVVSSAQVSSIATENVEKIRQSLDQCQKRVSTEALENMVKSIRDRGVV